MKKIKTLYFLLLVIFLFRFAQCKKEQDNQPHVGFTITLYNKPLDTIQFYLQGRWKCQYGKGGIAANMIQYYNDFYWTFLSNNRVLQSYNGQTITDTTITWIKNIGKFTSGDSTFLMSFYDKQNVPWVYIIKGISNDTLILYNNIDDAVFYHFTKSN